MKLGYDGNLLQWLLLLLLLLTKTRRCQSSAMTKAVWMDMSPLSSSPS